ncbi:MAG: cysteine-rich repeat protein [Polyangiales bacterium]|jgi:cysteine-rich repeat protein
MFSTTKTPHPAAGIITSRPAALCVAFALCFGLGFGCGDDTTPFDAATPDAGLTDVAIDTPRDTSQPDASTDANVPDVTDAGPIPIDTGPDTNPTDAGPDTPDTFDAGPTCDCPTDTECATFTCEAGACLETQSTFGTFCGESPMGFPSGICNAGACTPRTCGDGFVEPGPGAADGPAAEACDDGNAITGDACSDTCTTDNITVFSDPFNFDDPFDIPASVDIRSQRRSVGVDDEGAVLFVWRAADGTTPDSGGEPVDRLLIQRHDAAGVPLDAEPVELIRGFANFDADVLGLPSGWVVAYSNGTRIVHRRIAQDGTLSSAVPISSGVIRTETRPRLARIDVVTGGVRSPGFVALWQDSPDLYARRFRVSPSTISAVDSAGFMVDMPRRPSGIPRPVLASKVAGSGTHFLVTWTANDSAGTPSYAQAFGRRFNGASAIDSAAFTLAQTPPDGSVNLGQTPYAIGLASRDETGVTREGSFLVAWTGGVITGADLDVDHLLIRELPAGPSAAFPARTRLALGETDRRHLNPVLAAIPAAHPDPLTPATTATTWTGQVLVSWEVYEGSPFLTPEFAVYATGGVSATSPTAGSIDAFLARLRPYEGGLSAVATSPATGTRGVWLTAVSQVLPGEPDSLNVFVAFLLPVSAVQE